jgi:hypothetical protein
LCLLFIILTVRQVTLEEATQKATQLNIMFMETSAKAGHNVKTLFKKIAMSLPGMEKDGATADAANSSTFLIFISIVEILILMTRRCRSERDRWECRRSRGVIVSMLSLALVEIRLTVVLLYVYVSISCSVVVWLDCCNPRAIKKSIGRA